MDGETIEPNREYMIRLKKDKKKNTIIKEIIKIEKKIN